mgnify:CR=1 FL=1
MKNISVNGFNGIFGDRRIKRLVKKLNKNCISYRNERRKFKSEYPWSDYYVISGLTIPGMIKKGFVDPDVALAYQYQFPEKANSMTFTDASGGIPQNAHWDFGDGTTATGLTPYLIGV